MALNPSIALQAKGVTIEDPLDRRARKLALAGQEEVLQRTSLENTVREQSLADEQAMRQVFQQNPNASDDELLSKLGTRALPILKQRREQQKADAEFQTAQSKLHQVQAEILGSIANSINDEATFRSGLARAKQLGVLPPEAIDQLAAMPWDDNTAAQIKQFGDQALSAKEFHAKKMSEAELTLKEAKEAREKLELAAKLPGIQADSTAKQVEAQQLQTTGMTGYQGAQVQQQKAELAQRAADAAAGRAVTVRGQNLSDARARDANVLAAKPLSAEAAKVYEVANSMVPELQQLKEAIKNGGRKAVLGILTGTDTNLARLASNAADKVGRLRSGGAVNPNEEARFMGQIARWMDLSTGNTKPAEDAIDRLIGEAQGVATRIRPTGGVPGQQQTGGVPGVGSMFNGEKVLKVTRIP